MKKIDLKKFFSFENKNEELGSSLAYPVHYVRDWRIVVLVFAVGMVSLSIFSWKIYLSNKIAGGYLAPTIESTDTYVKTIDKKRLQADITILENKKLEFLQLKDSRPKSVDPSI